MIKLLLIIMLFNGCIIHTSAQQKQENPTYIFPDDWLGVWEGTLHIYKNQQVVQSVPMRLDHLSTDSVGVYIWAITYGTDTISGRRSYELRLKDIKKGHFVVDEKNGIFLDGFVFSNKYISNFEVMGNQLTSIYERKDDLMIFEIIVNTSSPINTTGNTTTEKDDTIPEVKSYPVIGYQKAVLSRKLK